MQSPEKGRCVARPRRPVTDRNAEGEVRAGRCSSAIIRTRAWIWDGKPLENSKQENLVYIKGKSHWLMY